MVTGSKHAVAEAHVLAHDAHYLAQVVSGLGSDFATARDEKSIAWPARIFPQATLRTVLPAMFLLELVGEAHDSLGVCIAPRVALVASKKRRAKAAVLATTNQSSSPSGVVHQ